MSLIFSRQAWTLIIGLIVFWIVAELVSFYPLSTFARMLNLWVSLAALYTYGRAGLDAMTYDHRNDDALQAALGMTLIFIGFVIQSAIIIYARFAYPDSPIMSDWITFTLILQTAGILYASRAPWAAYVGAAKRDWVFVGTLVGGVLTLTWVMLAFQMQLN